MKGEGRKSGTGRGSGGRKVRRRNNKKGKIRRLSVYERRTIAQIKSGKKGQF